MIAADYSDNGFVFTGQKLADHELRLRKLEQELINMKNSTPNKTFAYNKCSVCGLDLSYRHSLMVTNFSDSVTFELLNKKILDRDYIFCSYDCVGVFMKEKNIGQNFDKHD